jgi:Fic family protein
MKRSTGSYEKLGSLESFIPYPLPPHNPSFTMNSELTSLYSETMRSLEKLNEMDKRLPHKTRFIKAYVIKEALLSSAIEGIHTTLIDVFTQPLSGTINKETQLVLNYTTALDQAIELMANGLPISSQLLLTAHALLMNGEGDRANPGHYRKQAVRVGNLIPPPAQQLATLMADLETYINTDDSLPPLIKAGLTHVQFETIHPFLDGNGRIGRLLIVLMLINADLLHASMLYPSYYFKKHHFEYYQRLDAVRTQGDFEGWITYYLHAINEGCIDAYRRACDIELLEQSITQTLIDKQRTKKLTEPMQETIPHGLASLFQYPVTTISHLSKVLSKGFNTSNTLIQFFVDAQVLVEVTGWKRNKLYKFKPYLDLLQKEY